MRRISGATTVVALAGVLGGAAIAWGQHGHTGSHEATLRRLFASQTADDAAVRAAVDAVERARREVRLVHLLTHLRTRDLLTEEPRRIYHETRWGGR